MTVAAYIRNEHLFNHAFLNQLAPTPTEKEAMYSLVRSARAWLRQSDSSTSQALVDTSLRPFLLSQSLDLAACSFEPNAFFLIAPWNPAEPLGLLYVAPQGANLDGMEPDGRLPKGRHWMMRAVNAARRQNLRWAALTDGGRWLLLDSQGLRRYEAYLEIDLQALTQAGQDDPSFVQAAYLFATLFRLEGGFGRDSQTGRIGLDEFMERSQHAAERTERYLKHTVCDHLETPGGGDGIMAQLGLGLVRAVDPGGRHSFTDAEREHLYRDAVYLLYRLLFILYAEARGLLPADNSHYHLFSLSALVDEARLIRQDPTRRANRPTHLWDQLAALFNLIDIGDPGLAAIPAFDGGLFDNTERPYLSQYKIENLYLAEALVQLAFQPALNDPAALERIDYRDLSVRHLGSLYEGMIEYRLFIAGEDLLARQENNGRIHYLPALETPPQKNDERVSAGSVYFAQSPHERKATGTHYTAEDLVEKLVRQTLLRLVEERREAFAPALAALQDEQAHTPPGRMAAMQYHIDQELVRFAESQLLSLKICDPAMGSGHFLVHSAHQLTNAILETLTLTDWDDLEIDLSPALWRRRVVENCLYGVDINPVAVELAKLSLWLASMTPGYPLTFLDHRLKTGNSLLGVRFKEIVDALQPNELTRVTRKSAVAEQRGQYSFKQVTAAEQATEVAVRLLDNLTHRDASSLAGVEAQKSDYRSAWERLEAYRRVADFLTALKMGLKHKHYDIEKVVRAIEKGEEPSNETAEDLWYEAQCLLGGHRTFHWDLEFPNVFLVDVNSPGFDVVIGNPPFLGGYKISGELGAGITAFLRESYLTARGQADLCAYMLRKYFDLMSESGLTGIVATNSISQGDTRESGLSYILNCGGQIIYADRYVEWKGDATVEVNLIGLSKTGESGNNRFVILDSQRTPYISSWLDDLPENKPFALIQNKGKAFIGDAVRGIGFIIELDEAENLFTKHPDYKNCLLPYLSGEDLNKDPEQKPSRYVICFHDWDIKKAEKFPILLDIVRERVKPIRDKVKEKREREHWWLFARYRGEMRRAIHPLDLVLARAVVSDTHAVTFLPKTMIFNHKVVVFAFSDAFSFTVLQSNIHELWMRRYTSTMRTDVNYSVSDCFLSFPFPQYHHSGIINQLDWIGGEYSNRRQSVMSERRLGLTNFYNLFHNPSCNDNDILWLREQQVKMDGKLLECYGWEDINLNYDFYFNSRHKIRFLPSKDAQREIIIRLMDLNTQVAAQEAAQGLSLSDMEMDDENAEE